MRITYIELKETFRPSYKNAFEYIEEKAIELIEFIKFSSAESEILYPGERALKTREENLKSGIPVNEFVWNGIINLI